MLPFAPGARAVIRDEEWLIRRTDPTVDGGWLLTCEGVSDLVRGQTALFLTLLEEAIEILDPAQTELVPDPSPTYNAAVLYLESQRRRGVANDESIHLGHRGVMHKNGRAPWRAPRRVLEIQHGFSARSLRSRLSNFQKSHNL
jgi:hypothetical protein